MSISTRHLIQFNQSLNFQDLKTGGNCLAYDVAVFTYISLFSIKYPHLEIEYSKLVKTLKTFPSERKKAIIDHQDNYRTMGELLDYEIANLNQNIDHDYFALAEAGTSSDKKLLNIAINICQHVMNFTFPSFYFIGYHDVNQKIMRQTISHTVLLYLASPDTIHFFDSLSGLYLINLPKKVTPEDLEKCLFNLMFKKNFLMRWGCRTTSETLQFGFARSYRGEVKNIPLEDWFEKLIKNPKISLDMITNDQDRHFLEMNSFVLQILNVKLESKEIFKFKKMDNLKLFKRHPEHVKTHFHKIFFHDRDDVQTLLYKEYLFIVDQLNFLLTIMNEQTKYLESDYAKNKNSLNINFLIIAYYLDTYINQSWYLQLQELEINHQYISLGLSYLKNHNYEDHCKIALGYLDKIKYPLLSDQKEELVRYLLTPGMADVSLLEEAKNQKKPLGQLLFTKKECNSEDDLTKQIELLIR